MFNKLCYFVEYPFISIEMHLTINVMKLVSQQHSFWCVTRWCNLLLRKLHTQLRFQKEDRKQISLMHSLTPPRCRSPLTVQARSAFFPAHIATVHSPSATVPTCSAAVFANASVWVWYTLSLDPFWQSTSRITSLLRRSSIWCTPGYLSSGYSFDFLNIKSKWFLCMN